ncbi:MAG: APC family permease [Nocardiopsaceae bacterium]|nr:APC family permease [Nocardiopsaceae bacterium]
MATSTGPEPVVTRPADTGLRREMGFIGAVWSSESSIIGSGWLFGALYAANAAGPAALIAWVIGGVIFAFLALVHAEIGAMYPVAGGTARFPHFAFGTVAGTSFGFFSWLQAITVAPVECFAVMEYAQHWWPALYNSSTKNVTGTGFVVTIVLLAIFTGINFFGIKWLAHTNSTIMWWKLAIPILAFLVLVTQWHSSNFGAAAGGFDPGGVKSILGAVAGAGIAFAYLGFEQADQLAGEIKNPQKNLPRAILAAVAIGTLIYILLQVAFIAAMNPHILATSHGWTGLTCPATGHCNPQVSDITSGPWAALAGIAGFSWLAFILRVDAVVSPFGTGLIYITSTSRVSYGVGKNRYFPAILTRTDKRGVPWVALILSFVGGLIFLLPFPSWHSLVNLITGASVLMYAGAPLALGAFRRQVPDANRPYRLGGASVVAPLAFILANFIIYWSGLEVIWKLGIIIVIGYVIIGGFMIFDKQRPPLNAKNWKAASWLPVYLIGMGIISWQGQYDGGAVLPPVNTNRIGLGWDLLIIAAFSLVIYFWAMAVRLPREEMLALVAKQGSDDPAQAGQAS